MSLRLDDFADCRPFVFHPTAKQNIGSVRREPRLRCASDWLGSAGRQDLVSQRRLRSETLQLLDGTSIHIRDQAPLHFGNIQLAVTWTPEDLVHHINQHVFFWPGTETGPVSPGRNHYPKYAKEPVAILRIPTTALFAANQGSDPLFCPYNSGAPRCSGGAKSPRGPQMHYTAVHFPGTNAKVVGVAFRREVMLPEQVQIGSTVAGPWSSF